MNELGKSKIAPISQSDVIWNIAASFFKVAGGFLLLPFILRYFPEEMVGIWTIFLTINTLVALLDFGFYPTFSRNVSYVLSGAKSLYKIGYDAVDKSNIEIDYSLLKGLISAMKWFYCRISLFVLILLLTIGSFYIHYILGNYHGNKTDIYIAWIVACLFNTCNFYTTFYDPLLLGSGLIKRSKQITIIGRSAYIIVAIILIINHFGIISIIAAQFISMIIIRILSHFSFFTIEIKSKLAQVTAFSKRNIIKAIAPNAVKVGLVYCSGIAVSQFTVFIAPIFLDLTTVASYGISIQLVTILVTISKLYIDTYTPKIVEYRTQNRIEEMRNIFIKGELYFCFIAVVGGISIVLLGDWALNLVKSQTQLLATLPLIGITIFSLLDGHQIIATNILLASNKVPFLKSSLITGIVSILMIIIFLYIFKLGIWALILGPGIVQILYQDWKWPLSVYQQMFSNNNNS